MKNSLKAFLSVSTIIAAMVITGCNDNKKGTPEPTPNEFAGEYMVSEKPLYSSMTAADPNAVAFKVEGEQPMEFTYAQLIMAAYGYLPTVELSEAKVTFNTDGTLVMKEIDEGQEYDLFPDPEEGLLSSFVTYSVKEDNFILTFSSDMINYIIEDTDNEANAAQIKTMLAAFGKGAFVYNAESNTATINLKYRKTDTDLYLYIDKALLEDTWKSAKPVASQIIALIEAAEPGSTQLAQAILPQIENILQGFTKIEVGAKMTKQ